MLSKNLVIQASLIICLALVIIGAGGCFSSRPEDINAFAKPEDVYVTCSSYVLQPPDEIILYCSEVPDVNTGEQRIMPDGTVNFPLIGDVFAAGKTPRKLADEIYEKLRQSYSLTDANSVNIRVVRFRSKVYYVLGQVISGGAKNYTGRDTVLTAVADSGLYNTAWVKRVQVIRPSKDKNARPKIFEVNLDRMVAHGDTSKNVLLNEGDIIYVPPTILGAIGLTIDELVGPIGRTAGTVNAVMGPPGTR